MRLPFQLTLAPLFLWGAFLSGERLGFALAAAFIALHFCLYTGITAFNSAYDQDEGPVSGMLHPPAVPPGLLAFSMLLQLGGAVIAAYVGPWFLAIYVAIALLAAAYSHPRTRWKADPFASAATVAIGQGVLGFLAGWCAASGTLPELTDPRALLGASVAGLTTLGLYPATQVFQVEEDEARGDRTLAVALGPPRALRFGSLCLAGAGVSAVWLMAWAGKPLGSVIIATAYLGIVSHNELFARRLSSHKLDVRSSYRWAMRTSFMSTGGFLLFIAVQLLAASPQAAEPAAVPARSAPKGETRMSGEQEPEGAEQPNPDPEAYAEKEGISEERASQLIRSTDDDEELDSAAEAAKRWS